MCCHLKQYKRRRRASLEKHNQYSEVTVQIGVAEGHKPKDDKNRERLLGDSWEVDLKNIGEDQSEDFIPEKSRPTLQPRQGPNSGNSHSTDHTNNGNNGGGQTATQQPSLQPTTPQQLPSPPPPPPPPPPDPTTVSGPDPIPGSQVSSELPSASTGQSSLPLASITQSPSTQTPIGGSTGVLSVSDSKLSVITASLATSRAILVGTTATTTTTSAPTVGASDAVPAFTSGAIPIHSGSSGVSIPRIISGIFGGLVALILLVLLALFFIRRQKRQNDGRRFLLSRASDRSEQCLGPFAGSPGDMTQSSSSANFTATASRVREALKRWRNSGDSGWEFDSLGDNNASSVLESRGNRNGGARTIADGRSGQDCDSAFPVTVAPPPHSLHPTLGVSASRFGPWQPFSSSSIEHPRSRNMWI